MPFVKPEWKSVTNKSDNTPICIQGLIARYDEDMTYEEETMTKGDYLKNVIFDGKYPNMEIVDHGRVGSEGEGFGLYALYFDRVNNPCASIFAGKANPNYGYRNGLIGDYAFHAYMHIADKKADYNSSINLLRAFIWSQSTQYGAMYAKSFKTFCVTYHNGYNSAYNTGTSRTCMLYDFTNKEFIVFDDQLANIQFSKPDHYVYSKPLTRDGANGQPYNKVTRTSSNSEVRYTKLKFIDGTESKRIYMLSQLPARAEDAILTMESKKFYVLPYYSDSYCALAIECTADVTE